LRGQPTDGSGKVCIHLFVRDDSGPITTPHAILPVYDDKGEQVRQAGRFGSARGRLACDPKRLVAPVAVGGHVVVTMRTDDPEAATCPVCLASRDYKAMMDRRRECLQH
jgi:hypothetical protein